jgi:type VI secretion system protein ImpF
MPELSNRERLQPSLLDRLTDKEPQSQRETRADRVMSVTELRECVRRDWMWLLNTPHLESVQPEVQSLSRVARSVLNFGMPDGTGHTVSNIDTEALERKLREVVCAFEPRLSPKTVRVRVVADTHEMSHNAMSFVIEGDLWAQPIPVPLLLKTSIDFETGAVSISELPRGGAA